MGLYGSAPEAPDPKQTASAQTATNIGTAVANNVMGNANQVTPDGNLTCGGKVEMSAPAQS